MKRPRWLVGIAALACVGTAARDATAQNAWQVAQMCSQMNYDPQFRPQLDAQVRERPPLIGTVSGGFTMMNTRRGGFGDGSGIGLGGNAQVEAELGFMHPFWVRTSAQFTAAGRFGFIGDVSVGLTARSYGVSFVPAGAQLTVSRYYVSYSSWNNHCALRRFDFHGFTGVRWGTFFGRDIMDSSGMTVLRQVPFEAWLAPQLGVTFRLRTPGGRTTDTTIAGMVDVLNGGSWGLYVRSYATVSYFLFGADFGFFLPFDGRATATHQPWDMFWFTANLGVHFEL